MIRQWRDEEEDDDDDVLRCTSGCALMKKSEYEFVRNASMYSLFTLRWLGSFVCFLSAYNQIFMSDN